MKFDLITSDKIRARLDTKRFGRKIYAFWQVSSTNRFAAKAAARGEPEGTLVIAEMQTRGKGRLKRSWDSQFGKGLWFSVILRPSFSYAKAGLFPFLAGISVVQAIENSTGLKPEFKWPNDLLFNNKKFCGILSEVEFIHYKINYIILGVGINIFHKTNDFPNILSQSATSLHLEGAESVDRIDLLTNIIKQLEFYYYDSTANGFKESLEIWKSRCPQFGNQIRIFQNGRHIQGIFENLDSDGCLMLRTPDKSLIRIAAGDLY